MADDQDITEKAQRSATSHLFLVRLWEASLDGTGAHTTKDGTLEREWKGKVQHVISGESHTFQDLAALLDYLRAMMPTTTE